MATVFRIPERNVCIEIPEEQIRQLARNCAWPGCHDPGIYFQYRLKHEVKKKCYCEEHDKKLAAENLARWSRETGGEVKVLRDNEGEFDGVLIPEMERYEGTLDSVMYPIMVE